MSDFWEKLQARRELKRKIDEIDNEITMLRRVKEEIERIQLQMEDGIDDWDTEYTRYKQLELAEDIQVTESFEGKAAEELALNFPPCVKEINEADGQAAGVVSAIGDQLTEIDEAIETRKITLEDLYAQLEAL